MRVYLAARFSRRVELGEYRRELQAFGVDVRSTWLDGGHQFSGVPDEEIAPADLAPFAVEDVAEVRAADLLIAFTDDAASAPSRPSKGGMWVEVGVAIGARIPVLVVGPRANVFCNLPTVTVARDWPSALRYATGMAASLAYRLDMGGITVDEAVAGWRRMATRMVLPDGVEWGDGTGWTDGG